MEENTEAPANNNPDLSVDENFEVPSAEEVLEVIGKEYEKADPNQFEIIDIKSKNGWGLYFAILAARDKVHGINETLTAKYTNESLQIAKSISADLNIDEKPNKGVIKKLLTVVMSDPPTEEEYNAIEESLKGSGTGLSEIQETRVIDSLKFQLSDKGPIYLLGRDGKKFNDASDYINKLSTLLEPTDINSGPIAWADTYLVGRKIVSIPETNINKALFIYIPVADDTNPDAIIYRLLAICNEDQINNGQLFILYQNRETYSALIPKGGTETVDAESFGLSTTKDARLTPSDRFKKLIKDTKDNLKKLGATLKRSGKLFKTGLRVDEVMVAGEKVNLSSETFRENYTDLAENDETLDMIKKVFASFFNPENYVLGRTPEDGAPPCKASERDILYKCLFQRLNILYSSINNLRSQGDTLQLRSSIQHYQNLYSLLKNLDDKGKNNRCVEFNEDGSITGFSKNSTEFDDEMRTLLRQFAFMILQAKRPVNEYKEYTTVAQNFVGNLREIASSMESSDSMNAYLELWREQALETGENIPEVIAEVLDTTNTQTGVLQLMLEDSLKDLFNAIVVETQNSYDALGEISTSDTEGNNITISRKFNDFVATLKAREDMHYPDRIKQLVSWIVNNNRESWTIVKQFEELKLKMQTEKAATQEASDKNQRLLSEKTNELQAEKDNVVKLRGELEIAKNTSQRSEAECKEAIETAATKAERLERDLAKLAALNRGFEETVRKLEGQLDTNEGELIKARAAAAAAVVAERAAEDALKLAQQETKEVKEQTQGSLTQKEQAYRSDLEGKEAKIREQSGTIEQLQTSLSTTSIEKEGAEGRFSSERDRLSREARELKEKLELAYRDVRTALDGIQGKDDKIRKLETEILNLKSTTTRDTVAKETELSKLKEELRQVSSQKQMESEDLMQRIAALEGELSKTRAEHLALQNQKLSEAAANDSALKEAQERLADAELRASASSRALDEGIQLLRKETESQIASFRSQIEELTSAKKTAEKEAEEARKKQVEIDDEIRTLRRQLAAANMDNGSSQKGVRVIIDELRKVAESITTGRDYRAPGDLVEGASPALNSLIANINQMKHTMQGSSSSNQICFLSYFIIFFIKALFFKRSELERRKNVFNMFERTADQILISVRRENIFPSELEDKHVLYKVMEVIFSLIDTSETLFINKETRRGKEPTEVECGLSVIKSERDLKTKEIFTVIYNSFESAASNPTFMSDVLHIKNDLLKDFFMKQPNVYFNPPLALEELEGMNTEAHDLLNYPSFTYLLNDTATEVNKYNFQVINIEGEYSVKQVRLTDALGSGKNQEALWVKAIEEKLYDKKIDYTRLFILFIILGRKYLITAADDLKKYRYEVPELLKDPQKFMVASLQKNAASRSAQPCTKGNLKMTVRNESNNNPILKIFEVKLQRVENAKNRRYKWHYIRHEDDPQVVREIMFSGQGSGDTISEKFELSGTYTVSCDITYNISDATELNCSDTAKVTFKIMDTDLRVSLPQSNANNSKKDDVVFQVPVPALQKIVEVTQTPTQVEAPSPRNPGAETPKLEIQPLEDIQNTMYAILEQIHRGIGTRKEKLLRTLSRSPIASTVSTQHMPIIRFIEKYDSYVGKIFKHNDLPNDKSFNVVFSKIWANLKSPAVHIPVNKYEFLHAFIFDFFKAYVIQYNYKNSSGHTMSIKEKIDMIFPEFLSKIGSIKLRSDCKPMFSLLGITIDTLRSYAISYNPATPDMILPIHVQSRNNELGYPGCSAKACTDQRSASKTSKIDYCE